MGMAAAQYVWGTYNFVALFVSTLNSHDFFGINLCLSLLRYYSATFGPPGVLEYACMHAPLPCFPSIPSTPLKITPKLLDPNPTKSLFLSLNILGCIQGDLFGERKIDAA